MRCFLIFALAISCGLLRVSASPLTQASSCDGFLKEASRTGSPKALQRFLDAYAKLDSSAQRAVRLNEQAYHQLLEFHSLLMRRKIDVPLLIAHAQLSIFFESSAEGGEIIDKAFGKRFVHNLSQMFRQLERIRDARILEVLAKSATFNEGNGQLIHEYLSKKKLTTKEYYRFFARYK